MSASYRISRLTKSNKALFISLMSRAFAQDPLFLHLFGESEQNAKAKKRVTAFVSFMFDKSFALREEVWGCFDNERLLGAYVVEMPQINKSPLLNAGGARLIGTLIPLLFRLPGRTWGCLNSYMRVTRSVAPSLPHHYLVMIGVDPKAQGQGIGKRLLNHLLDRAHADKSSQGVALDTENKENVSLYRRFGFALSREVQLDHLHVYCMFCRKER